MAVVIRDSNTEKQIEDERERRGHKTNARTARECLAEYFAILKRDRRVRSPREPKDKQVVGV